MVTVVPTFRVLVLEKISKQHMVGTKLQVAIVINCANYKNLWPLNLNREKVYSGLCRGTK